MMKRLFLMLIVAFVCSANADAQGWLGRLKDKAVDAAKRTVENTVEQKTEESVNDVLNSKSDKKSKGDKDAANVGDAGDDNSTTATASDFKRGSIIIFDDDVTAEQVGEFPSKWGMFQGTVETKTLGGVKAINLTDNAQVQPLIEQEGAYLPEEFTIEYDFYYWPTDNVPGNDGIGINNMKMILAVTKDRSEFPGERYDQGELTAFVLNHSVCNDTEQSYYFNGNKEGSLTTRSRRAGTM